jgi:UrcA family protein
MNSSLKIAIGSFLMAAAVIKAAPALAAPVQPNNVTVVHTADLDLASEAGRRQLDRRLATAAHEVCDTASDVDLAGKNAERQCRGDVLAQARARGESLIAGRGEGRTILVAARR